METFKRFLAFLKTFFGVLCAVTVFFPMSGPVFDLISVPSPDYHLFITVPSLFSLAIIVAIFLILVRSDRKYPTKGEWTVFVLVCVLGIIAFFGLYWLETRYIITIAHGNDGKHYHFIRGDVNELTSVYRQDWDKGKNASFPNYLKTLGYTSFADDEVFEHAFVAKLRVLFLFTYMVAFGCLTGIFTMLGAYLFRRHEYEAKRTHPT